MADKDLQIILTPLGGANQDDSALAVTPGEGGLSAFTQGDYRYALNMRIGATFKNNDGSGENLPSTLPITNYFVWNGSAFVASSAAAGTNTAINKYEDRSEGKVYWVVKNSNNNHAILMYVKSEQKIYELLRWSGLNISNFVSLAKINKYLILTDGNPSDGSGNPPRIIDVTDIYKLKYTLDQPVAPYVDPFFREYHISFAKWPPLLPMVLNNVAFAPTNGSIFISKGIYQFTFRYIYKGGFRSTWSPPSNFITNELLAAPNGGNPNPLVGQAKNFSMYALGFIFDYNIPANTAFTHLHPQFYNFAELVEFAYRDSQSANWKMYARFTVDPTGVTGFASLATFSNSGPVINIADSEMGQYSDSVPFLSRAVEAIDNRPIFANNLDDLVPLDTFDVTNVEVYSVQSTADNWFDGASLPAEISGEAPFQKFSFKENGVYKLGIIFQHYAGRTGLVQTLDKWTYTIPPNLSANPAAQEDYHALGFKIAGGVVPPIWAVGYQIVRTNCLNIDMFIVGVVNDFKFLKIDAITDNSLATADEIKAAISSYYDNYNNGGSQYSIITRILSAVRKNAVVATSADCTLIYMDITNWSLDTGVWAGSPTGPNPSNSVYYNWQPGDRVRFCASTASNFSGGPFVQYDQEIIEYTGTGLIISKPINLLYMGTRAQVSAATDSAKLFNIEVYRPKKYSKDNDVIFYEMGEWYPISQPGTVSRAFTKTDWTWGGSALVAKTTLQSQPIYARYPVVNGDVWLVWKNFFFNFITTTDVITQGYLGPFNGGGFTNLKDYPVFPQMTQDKSNAAGVWEHNTGRALASYRYLPKQFEKSSQMRFGGKFLEDSLFISINNFRDENQKLFPSEYGKIRALVNISNTQVKNVGNILLAICEEETMSIYINRTTLEDLAGNTQVTASDKVLGAFNTLLGSYGTLNPESVSKKNSRVIFWNQKRGMWIRYSDDGLTPISDVKMKNWFKDLSILLAPSFATNTPGTALSFFDPYYEEWVTYLNHSSLPGTFRGYASYKCVSFAERDADKRWKSWYDFAPQCFAELENEAYSIIGTVVNIHFAGADFGSFYGVKKDVMWQPVANELMRTRKIWQAINLQASDKWSFPSIQGDYKSNGATIQETQLALTDLTNIEDDFVADLKRDQNTPNQSDTAHALVNGNPMRSKSLTLMLKLDPAVTWLSLVNWLIVKYDLSEKTVKK